MIYFLIGESVYHLLIIHLIMRGIVVWAAAYFRYMSIAINVILKFILNPYEASVLLVFISS